MLLIKAFADLVSMGSQHACLNCYRRHDLPIPPYGIPEMISRNENGVSRFVIVAGYIALIYNTPVDSNTIHVSYVKGLETILLPIATIAKYFDKHIACCRKSPNGN